MQIQINTGHDFEGREALDAHFRDVVDKLTGSIASTLGLLRDQRSRVPEPQTPEE